MKKPQISDNSTTEINSDSLNLINAVDQLQPLADRWNETVVWHDPPFLIGSIHITTGDLLNIAIVCKKIREMNKNPKENIINKIDLNSCKPGDLLLSRGGRLKEYCAYISGESSHPHRIRIQGEEATSTYTNDGYFHHDKYEHPADIVQIIKKKPNDIIEQAGFNPPYGYPRKYDKRGHEYGYCIAFRLIPNNPKTIRVTRYNNKNEVQWMTDIHEDNFLAFSTELL
jgi:hypothetical protein